jgi:ATP-dependent DNA helicase RecQ
VFDAASASARAARARLPDRPSAPSWSISDARKGRDTVGEVDPDLFQRLRVVRRALADAEGVPAYIVFSDAVLARMAAARPRDEEGLLAISGVGPAKLARYGTAFLRVLREG